MAMDFISGPTTVATTTPRTPDSDTDTPPHPPPAKRSHHHYNHQQHHVSYKECLKNHAASIGGHALDGCCEFMPGPTANLLDPTSLTCAACGCHRNFHRRDPDDPTPLHHLIPPARKPHSPPSASQLLLSLSGHANSPSAPSDHEILQTPTNHPTSGAGVGSGGVGVVTWYYNNTTTNGGSGGQNGNLSFQSKKRFRTKFSQEQKDKMHEFSEKIGWKLKKGEERLVEEFCKQVGVDRSVFKVWMHNNKHTSSSSGGAATTPTSHRTTSTTATTGFISTTTATSTNGNHDNNNITNNITNTSNVGGLNNCGGVLGAATTALEFNFGNGVGQEAKAQ